MTATVSSMRERWAWAALLLLTVWSRLWELGVRMMTHDESLHAYYSFILFRDGTYRHDPIYHGPLLYHLNAWLHALFGVSDFTARLVPTVLGIALVASLWAFRPWLGRRGAFLAALLIAVSPTLMFYSRHIRNDIYIAFFLLWWVYALLRYLHDGRERWLWLLTSMMALSFLAKEVSFISGAIAGAFVVVWGFVGRRSSTSKLERARAGDLAVLMLTLVLPYAAGAVYGFAGWNFVAISKGGDWSRLAAVLGVLFLLAALAAWIWSRRRPRAAGDRGAFTLASWARLMTMFWVLALLFFTTFLRNFPQGIVSGTVGSLGYWLSQQDVARGSQPWFYYPLVALLYELLALFAGGLGLLLAVRHLGRRTVASAGAPDDAPGSRDALAFLVFWSATSWIAYTVAGEKMPWLLTHMVLPLCLIGGWGMARVLPRDDARRGDEEGAAHHGIAVAVGVVAVVVLVVSILVAPHVADPLAAAGLAARGALRWLLLVVALVVALRSGIRLGAGAAARWAACGIAALLLVLTVRTALRVNFVTFDQASEHLSYAQSSPDVRLAMAEIADLSARTTGDRQLEVAYDDQSSWPFVWYLRDYPKARTFADRPELVGSAPVILAGPKNVDGLWSRLGTNYARRDYQLIWWPLQDYTGKSLRQLVASLLDGERRQRLWRIFAYRDYPWLRGQEWPLRQDLFMFVRHEVLAEISGNVPRGTGAAGAGEPPATLTLAPRATWSGPYDGRALSAPTDIAVAAPGLFVLADAGNHRLLWLDREGVLQAAVGGERCAAAEPDAPGCLDTDGTGPLPAGAEQVNEPWGVSVGGGGLLAVADTWNGRVTVFDGERRWQRSWGTFGSDPRAEPMQLFGPRDVLWLEDRLLVSDTGNKRLIVLGAEGRPVAEIGGTDSSLSLDEPVGLAADPNGTWLLADSWNRRLLRFDRRFNLLAAMPVPAWRSQAASDKPYVAVGADSTLFVSDPATSRVLVLEPSGALSAALQLPAAESPARPVGLAVDPGSDALLVVDHANARVLVYDRSRLRAPAAASTP